MAPRYSEEYEVVEVLGDGYTYNLTAVNHNGRPKSRHFNLLKTVSRLGQVDSPSDIEARDVDYHPSVETSNVQEEGDTPGGEGTTSGQSANDQRNANGSTQDGWVRRSSRTRKNVEILQADGKKKSYSSSKAVDLDDSD